MPPSEQVHDTKHSVTTRNTNSTKHYIGMTANTFKERYRDHIKSFQNKKYSNDTELSKYIWNLKENGQDFDVTWSILKHAQFKTMQFMFRGKTLKNEV
jgi:hypothetical protein